MEEKEGYVRFADAELEEEGVFVLYATPYFYNQAYFSLLTAQRGGTEIENNLMKPVYKKIVQRLSAFSVGKKGLSLNTLFCVGSLKDDFGEVAEGVDIIVGGNLANIMNSHSCNDFALYVKNGELNFKGYWSGTDKAAKLVIRELQYGLDMTLTYNTAKNLEAGKKKGYVLRNTNSIGQLVLKAINAEGAWKSTP